jgi:hypothetical protein
VVFTVNTYFAIEVEKEGDVNQSQQQIQQGRGGTQFQLRLPDNLKAKILEASSASGRSLNSEIVLALTEKYLPAAERSTIDPSKLYTLEEASMLIAQMLASNKNQDKS